MEHLAAKDADISLRRWRGQNDRSTCRFKINIERSELFTRVSCIMGLEMPMLVKRKQGSLFHAFQSWRVFPAILFFFFYCFLWCGHVLLILSAQLAAVTNRAAELMKSSACVYPPVEIRPSFFPQREVTTAAVSRAHSHSQRAGEVVSFQRKMHKEKTGESARMDPTLTSYMAHSRIYRVLTTVSGLCPPQW